MALTCIDQTTTCNCNCDDRPEQSGTYNLMSIEWDNTSNCCGYTCADKCGANAGTNEPLSNFTTAQGVNSSTSRPRPPRGKFSKASGKFMRREKGGTGQPVQWKKMGGKFMRREKGGTGQPVQWKRASGEIFGLSTQQALIAVGVGVAAYFIIKKLK